MVVKRTFIPSQILVYSLLKIIILLKLRNIYLGSVSCFFSGLSEGEMGDFWSPAGPGLWTGLSAFSTFLTGLGDFSFTGLMNFWDLFGCFTGLGDFSIGRLLFWSFSGTIFCNAGSVFTSSSSSESNVRTSNLVWPQLDHSSIRSEMRWVDGARKWQFLLIYSTIK